MIREGRRHGCGELGEGEGHRSSAFFPVLWEAIRCLAVSKGKYVPALETPVTSPPQCIVFTAGCKPCRNALARRVTDLKSDGWTSAYATSIGA